MKVSYISYLADFVQEVNYYFQEKEGCHVLVYVDHVSSDAWAHRKCEGSHEAVVHCNMETIKRVKETLRVMIQFRCNLIK